MKKIGVLREFNLRVGTLMISAALSLSLPVGAQDPFGEISSSSWVYISVLDIVSSGYVKAPSLMMPKAGEPLLRIEAAMVLNSIINELQVNYPEAGELPHPGQGEGQLRAYLTALSADTSPEFANSLLNVIIELQPELQIISPLQGSSSENTPTGKGIIGSGPVTLRVTGRAEFEFIDIDKLTTTHLGLVSAGQLTSLARQYFRENLDLCREANLHLVPDVAVAAPLNYPRPELSVASELDSAEYLALANLEGWQRMQPGLFNQDGSLTDELSTLYFLGGEAKVLSGLTLGTLWVAEKQLADHIGEKTESSLGLKTLSGKLQLRPEFTIIGEYTQSVTATKDPVSPDDAAAKLGAVFRVGEVQLGADVRGVGPGFSSPLFEDSKTIPNSSGYGLSVRYRNLSFETTHETVKPATEGESEANRTALQLNYSFADRALLTAGYEFVDVDAVDPLQPELRERESTALLGVDVSLTDNTKLEAGLKFGWQSADENNASFFDTKQASAGIQWRLPWEADLKLKADYEVSNNADQNTVTTMVGLDYNFLDNASLLLGYQLINFDSETDEGETKAGAELSISF